MRIQSILLLLITSSLAFGAELTGKWKAEIVVENKPLLILYDLTASGTVLTGTVNSEHGLMKISDGKVQGNQFSFVVVADDFTAISKGTISGDELKMKVDVDDRTIEITAKRASAK